jgi:hypothetical protein
MPNLDEQIKKAAKANAFNFGSNRELRRLRQHLNNDESVLGIITGSRLNKRGRGIVVATNERLLFIHDGWVFRENQDYPYETISSVEFSTKIFFGVFTLYGKGDETSYNWVGRSAGAKFTKLVRQLTADAAKGRQRQPDGYSGRPASQNPLAGSTGPLVAPPLPPVQNMSAPLSGPDLILKQLNELGEMREKGFITPEEYDLKKQELLARL